ncbi:MAG: hypothetical protein LBV47_07795 [Bacteroidales bacterium]|jgi:hypothetical protein|nr:hypothetical protein [Bacteroidales bacterium]
MKKKSEISGYFHVQKFRKDKRVIIFTVCLSIAAVLWFINALGKNYSTVVTYPIKFVNPPSNKFVTMELPPKLELKVEARGFILLRHKLSLSFSPFVVNISEITKDLTSKSGAYNIQTSGLLGHISNQMGNEINIIGIQQPEYFSISLDSITEKWVQVLPSVQLNFRPQYKLKGKVGVLPERVFIKGPAILLDTLSALYTRPRLFEKLSTDVERSIKIEYPANTEITPDKVTLKIHVEKSTEKELKIPVVLKNNPDSLNIKFFPSEIKVAFLVGLSEFEKITEAQFSAVVDYNEINNETTYINIEIEDKPDNIDNIRIFPETVEFLIESD